jgi:putative salt-induced outer membrane protein YdiY
MFRSRKTVTVLALALCVLLPVAMFPTEGAGPDGWEEKPVPKPVKWTGAVNFSWTQTAGNTESIAASLSAETARKAEKSLFEANAKVLYGETDGDQTADKGDSLLRYSYSHSKRFFSFCEGGAYYDDCRRLDVGTRVAVGVGRKFADTEKTKLNGRLGIAWTNEEYMEGTDDEEYTSVTGGFDLSQTLTETLLFTLKASSDVDTSDSDNWTLIAEAALKSKVSERISVIVSATDKYDNDPPPGVKENDFTLMVGIGFAF